MSTASAETFNCPEKSPKRVSTDFGCYTFPCEIGEAAGGTEHRKRDSTAAPDRRSIHYDTI